MSEAPPDIVLLGAQWQARALLRAQLIEEGYDVVATDAWPMPRQYLRPGMRPRLVIVDLQDLAEPEAVLADLHALMPPEHVLVITALGTVPTEDLRRLGFHVLARPTSVRDIVTAASALLRTT